MSEFADGLDGKKCAARPSRCRCDGSGKYEDGVICAGSAEYMEFLRGVMAHIGSDENGESKTD